MVKWERELPKRMKTKILYQLRCDPMLIPMTMMMMNTHHQHHLPYPNLNRKFTHKFNRFNLHTKCHLISERVRQNITSLSSMCGAHLLFIYLDIFSESDCLTGHAIVLHGFIVFNLRVGINKTKTKKRQCRRWWRRRDNEDERKKEEKKKMKKNIVLDRITKNFVYYSITQNNNNTQLLVSLPLYFFYAVFIVYTLRIAQQCLPETVVPPATCVCVQSEK